MKLIDCIKMAFSDLNKRKMRTILTSFGIAIGTMLVILMSGLGQGIQTISNDQVKQMDSLKVINVQPKENSVKNQGKYKKIDVASLNKFKSIKGVSKVLAAIDTTATEVSIGNKSGKKISIHGSNLNFPIFTNAEKTELNSDKKKLKKYGSSEEIIAGSTINKNDNSSVLIGKSLLTKLGIKDYKSIIGKNIDITVSFPKIDGIAEKLPLILHLKVAGVVNNAYDLGKYTVTTSDETAAQIQEYYLSLIHI